MAKKIAFGAAMVLAATLGFYHPKAEMPHVTYSYSNVEVTMENGDVISGSIVSWADYNETGKLKVALINGTTVMADAEAIGLVPIVY